MKQILIVVPFRDRHEHLKDFLNHTPKYFYNQNISFDILITELDSVGDWNAGICCNSVINFNINEKYEYIYIHHVDVFPLKGEWFFPNENEVLFNLGDYGSCIMKYEYFFNVGGYSNNFWGWGYEDDCLYRRLIYNDYKMIDFDYKILFETRNQKHDRVIDEINKKNSLSIIDNDFIYNNNYNKEIDGVYDTNNYGKTHSLIKIDNNIYKHNIYPLIKSPRELKINSD
jgi:hypothetical protein